MPSPTFLSARGLSNARAVSATDSMPMALPPSQARLLRSRILRWLALLAASLLLHVVLLAAAGGGLHAGRAAPQPQVMSVSLQAARPAEAVPAVSTTSVAATQTKAAAPTRSSSRPRRRARATPVAVAAAADPAPVGETAPAPGPAPASLPDSVPGIASEIEPPDTPPVAQQVTASDRPVASQQPSPESAGSAVPAATRNPAATGKHYRVDLPPSATLDYEVRYVTRGNTTRGSSVIAWRNDAGNYAIRGEVTKFGFTLSSFRSEGMLDADGIAPLVYAEKNARRPETNTHFSRDERQAISFSASTEHYPLTSGSQDRGSILWQLAGIGRGNPAQLAPGAVLDVFVAGVRDAEHWLIEVTGEETIALEHGDTRAWHLVRAPRAGTYDKRIDIWLAPAQQWYPVKLRYTEVSGDTLDLSLNEIR